MQRGCMETAALVLDQKTFSFHRKLNLNFMQKNFFYQSCVCKVVEPMFETGFWPFYWVSSGGWWLYRLMYPHRFSGSKRKYLNWLLVLNMLGFVKFWHFSLWWLRPQLDSTTHEFSKAGQWLFLVGMVPAWIVDMGLELRLQPQAPLDEDRLWGEGECPVKVCDETESAVGMMMGREMAAFRWPNEGRYCIVYSWANLV